jgi:two-component system chemotaxis response regulator CheB
MVVDDAVVVRGLIARWLDQEPDMHVVASLRTGREAVEQLERANPDVVVLDIEMPELDGISALPLLLAKKRDLVVLMSSTLTRRNAEISLKALSLGAADYIPKPETSREVTTSATFRHDLIERIRTLGNRRRRPTSPAGRAPAPSSLAGDRALAPRACAGRDPAAAVLDHDAARAADRLLDRRTAGAHRTGRQARRHAGPGARADHPAHAADLHHDSRRASGALEPPAGA